MNKVLLRIKGMHCSSCAMSIDFDLEDSEGVARAKTSYAQEECEVEFDEEKFSVQQIIEVIQRTGYQAKLKQEN
ncbi:MAG: Cu2+-exporting ATPase [Microgenomates group bacterium Gr01-1014_7]|nr:MAG: Cu2+-exporting ATPase [Microgenomates group bacterium Gr01-1014_7]